MQLVLKYVEAQGNPLCWQGTFTYDTCCRLSSSSCWDVIFTPEYCCQAVAGNVPGLGKTKCWNALGVTPDVGFRNCCASGHTSICFRDFMSYSACCGSDVIDEDKSRLPRQGYLRRFDTAHAALQIHLYLHSSALRQTPGLNRVFLVSDVLRVHRQDFVGHLNDTALIEAAVGSTSPIRPPSRGRRLRQEGLFKSDEAKRSHLSDQGSQDDVRPGAFFLVYAESDEFSVEALRAVQAAGGVWEAWRTGNLIPHPEAQFHDRFKARYIWTDRMALETLSGAASAFTKHFHRVGRQRTSLGECICQALAMAAHVIGAYVEIGVFQGESALVAIGYMARARAQRANKKEVWEKREVFLLDTFTGFDYDEAFSSSEVGWAGTHRVWATAKDAMNAIHALLEPVALGTVPFKLIESNIIRDELPASVHQIAVALIDVDTYEATLAALHKVASLVRLGGLIVLDDPPATPGLAGSLLAMHEFLESRRGDGFVKMLWTGAYVLLRTL